MAISLSLQANVRKTTSEAYSGGVQNVDQNSRGDLCVAQSLPMHVEAGRLGQSWSLAIATAGPAIVAAWPTTLANIVLYNGEPTGGKSYIIDTVWVCETGSLATASSFSVLAQLSNAGVAAPADNAAELITSRVGKPIYSGNAKRAVVNTAYMVAQKWTIIGTSNGHPATGIGAGALCEVLGRFIVPPSACFGINLIGSTAGGTYIQGIDWFEAQLDLA